MCITSTHVHVHVSNRNDAFKELSAMAVEYGTPQFFLTFTGLPLHCTILSHDVTRSFASHSNSLRSKRAGLVRPHGSL